MVNSILNRNKSMKRPPIRCLQLPTADRIQPRCVEALIDLIDI